MSRLLLPTARRNASPKRVAIFLPGGIADRNHGVHIPPLRNLVISLSKVLDVTVYTLKHGREVLCDESCGDAIVKYISAGRAASFLGKFWAFHSAFKHDHSSSPYDLVHGFWAIPSGLVAVLLGFFYNIPSAVTLLGGETANLKQIQYGNMRFFLKRFLTLWTCAKASALLVLTRFQRDQLSKYRFERRNIDVIPLGVDTKVFRPNGTIRVRSPFRFVHVANLTEVKDQETLLCGMSKIARTARSKLRIIGPDYLGGKLQRRVRELGLEESVDFEGYIENRDLLKHYQWAHLLLHTSLHEAQGIVVAEAAACGLPSVGTRVGLISDFDQTKAIAVDVGDSMQLASQTLEILRDRKRLNLLRARALAWARKHDLRWTVKQYQKVYSRMLNSPQS